MRTLWLGSLPLTQQNGHSGTAFSSTVLAAVLCMIMGVATRNEERRELFGSVPTPFSAWPPCRLQPVDSVWHAQGLIHPFPLARSTDWSLFATRCAACGWMSGAQPTCEATAWRTSLRSTWQASAMPPRSEREEQSCAGQGCSMLVPRHEPPLPVASEGGVLRRMQCNAMQCPQEAAVLCALHWP